jgi:excinuclease ABC subunit C
LCPGVCASDISLDDYRQQIRRLILFFDGRKDKVATELEREMKRLARQKEYEEAAYVRDRFLALAHLKDISLIRGAFEEKTMAHRSAIPHRIEAFDVSNIFGQHAVGAMVVFIDGQPAKSEYKRFKIRTVKGISDTGALIEILRRRFQHSALVTCNWPLATRQTSGDSRVASREIWPLPNLIVIDGGKAQLNAGVKVLTELGWPIPILAVAKGRERKKADQYYYGPGRFQDERLLRQIRDEAHRFAINYYRTLHRKQIGKGLGKGRTLLNKINAVT